MPKPNAKPRRRKALKANYGDATPEDVARALHRYRPGKTAAKPPAPPAPVNSRA